MKQLFPLFLSELQVTSDEVKLKLQVNCAKTVQMSYDKLRKNNLYMFKNCENIIRPYSIWMYGCVS